MGVLLKKMNVRCREQVIISPQTVRRIRYAVAGCHVLVVALVLAASIISDWLKKDEVPTITIEFFDPTLKNVVDNPSLDPDPSNPVPPSGSPDAGDPQPQPPQPEPEPPQPEIVQELPQVQQIQVKPIAQPKVQPRSKPKPKINKNLPKAQIEKVQPIAQPKVKARPRPRKKPAVRPNPNARTGNDSRRANSGVINPNGRGKPGRIGTNPEPGHTAPGGQRGNSGYDAQIALYIRRLWVTPDRPRLGGSEPSVLITITIAANGRVTSKQMKPCGILAMDESIRELLNSLTWVKPPYDGRPHTLAFSIKAEND